MIDKKGIEFSKKISEGLKESNQKLIERTRKNKGYLVISRNNKIEKINSDALPENILDIDAKYK